MALNKIKSLNGFDGRWLWLQATKVIDQGKLYCWRIYNILPDFVYYDKIKYKLMKQVDECLLKLNHLTKHVENGSGCVLSKLWIKEIFITEEFINILPILANLINK